MVDNLIKQIGEIVAILDKNIYEWGRNPDGDYCYPINYCEKEKEAWAKLSVWLKQGKTAEWIINKIEPLIPKYKKDQARYAWKKWKEIQDEEYDDDGRPSQQEHDAACRASSWEVILKWVTETFSYA